MKQVYLLTGRPGTGKTSLIKHIATEYKDKAGGFYTEEIRSQGKRLGFKLVTLDGQQTVLALTDFHSRYHVGKYGVDIDGLDRIGVAALRKAAHQDDLVVVDEIGKMELFSAKFRETVFDIIKSGKKVLGTIMSASNPWADDIKRRPEVYLVEVTRTNRHQLLDDLRQWLGKS